MKQTEHETDLTSLGVINARNAYCSVLICTYAFERLIRIEIEALWWMSQINKYVIKSNLERSLICRISTISNSVNINRNVEWAVSRSVSLVTSHRIILT